MLLRLPESVQCLGQWGPLLYTFSVLFELFLHHIHVLLKVYKTCVHECNFPKKILNSSYFPIGSSINSLATSHHYLSLCPPMHHVVSHFCEFTMLSPCLPFLTPHHLPGSSSYSFKIHTSTSSSGKSFQISHNKIFTPL